MMHLRLGRLTVATLALAAVSLAIDDAAAAGEVLVTGKAHAVENCNPESRAAYKFAEERAGATYASFTELHKHRPAPSVVWWHASEGPELPGIAPDSIEWMKQFVQEGGSLFLSGYAPQLIVQLGMQDAPPDFVRGEPGRSGLWGLATRRQHPIFSGLPDTIRLVSGGLPIGNRLCWWSHPETFDGEWLADVERRGNIMACGELKFGKGKVIVLGVGAFSWDTQRQINRNAWQLHLFTLNVLRYLGASTIDDDVEQSAVRKRGALQWSAGEEPSTVVSPLRPARLKPGVPETSQALYLDGYSTYIDLGRWQPELEGQATQTGMSLSARFAIEEYPTAFAPIANQYSRGRGFKFGLTQYGRAKLAVAIGDDWIELESESTLPMGEWLVCSAVVSPGAEATIFLNEKVIAERSLPEGSIQWARETPLLLGLDCQTDYVADMFPTGSFAGLIQSIQLHPTQSSARPISIGSSEQSACAKFDVDLATHDHLRPAFHLLPPKNWTNEPHALIRHENKYQLFCQANPNGPYWNFIRWGRMESDDLVNWRWCGVALRPQKDAFDLHGCWSGASIVDREGKLRLFYTGVNGRFAGIGVAETEDGEVYRQRADPIIANRPEESLLDFRDPYLWRDQKADGSDRFHMIVGTGVPNIGGAIVHYTSANLESWEYTGHAFTGERASSGDFWEMPVMLDFDGSDETPTSMLTVTELPPRSSYWTGKWVENQFEAEHDAPKPIDLFPYFLSPTLTRDNEGEWVAIGIVPETRNEASQQLAGWSHLFGIPRRWRMAVSGSLQQTAHPSLQQLRLAPVSQSGTLDEKGMLLAEGQLGQQCELSLEIEVGDVESVDLTLLASHDDSQGARISYFPATRELKLDLSQANPAGDWKSRYPAVQSTRLAARGVSGELGEGLLRLNVFVDHSVVDVFVNEGEAFSFRAYPDSPEHGRIQLSAKNGSAKLKRGTLWPMKSIWRLSR